MDNVLEGDDALDGLTRIKGVKSNKGEPSEGEGADTRAILACWPSRVLRRE